MSIYLCCVLKAQYEKVLKLADMDGRRGDALMVMRRARTISVIVLRGFASWTERDGDRVGTAGAADGD